MVPGSPPPSDPLAPTGPLEFDCPRCGDPATETYYGPCETCREALVASLGGAGRLVEVAAYQPKVNVTPNAVATKD